MNFKVFVSIFFFASISLNSWSKEPKKLASAIETSKTTHQHILLYFSGSDWCRPCIRLSKEVLNTKEFKDFAGKNLLILQVDFPRGRNLTREEVLENIQLAEKYNPDGVFPLLVLLDDNLEVLTSLKYTSSDFNYYIQNLSPFLSQN